MKFKRDDDWGRHTTGGYRVFFDGAFIGTVGRGRDGWEAKDLSGIIHHGGYLNVSTRKEAATTLLDAMNFTRRSQCLTQ